MPRRPKGATKEIHSKADSEKLLQWLKGLRPLLRPLPTLILSAASVWIAWQLNALTATQNQIMENNAPPVWHLHVEHNREAGFEAEDRLVITKTGGLATAVRYKCFVFLLVYPSQEASAGFPGFIRYLPLYYIASRGSGPDSHGDYSGTVTFSASTRSEAQGELPELNSREGLKSLVSRVASAAGMPELDPDIAIDGGATGTLKRYVRLDYTDYTGTSREDFYYVDEQGVTRLSSSESDLITRRAAEMADAPAGPTDPDVETAVTSEDFRRVFEDYQAMASGRYAWDDWPGGSDGDFSPEADSVVARLAPLGDPLPSGSKLAVQGWVSSAAVWGNAPGSGPAGVGGLLPASFIATTGPWLTNVRMAPWKSADVLAVLPPGTRLFLEGWVHGDVMQDGWYNVPDDRWYRIREADSVSP